MFTGVAAARFAHHDPVRAGAVVAGVLALAALASMFNHFHIYLISSLFTQTCVDC